MPLKGNIRRQLTGLMQRLLKTEELRRFENRRVHDYDAIRRQGLYQFTPYGPGRHEVDDQAPRREPVFVTGRFRSGSTLLWNLFRNLPDHISFYEPFNERRWFDEALRGGHTDTTHRGVSEYWSEYRGLAELTHFYNEDWIRYRLYMAETTFDYRMKRFIDTLIGAGTERAVLQFNRMDFRLPWLRANYPKGRIVHIYRNPRDQWCSTLRNASDYPATARSKAGFPDHFYLGIWSRDLVRQFPFLAEYEDKHRYYVFYLIWKLSYCFGVRYSDISVAMESLTHTPEKTLAEILSAVGSDAGLVESIDLSFVEPANTRWQQYASEKWFSNIERECDDVVREFLQGVAG